MEIIDYPGYKKRVLIFKDIIRVDYFKDKKQIGVDIPNTIESLHINAFIDAAVKQCSFFDGG